MYYSEDHIEWLESKLIALKQSENVVLDGVVKCNCANESTDIYDEHGNLLGWACLHNKIIEQ